jgi:hypothetical protein
METRSILSATVIVVRIDNRNRNLKNTNHKCTATLPVLPYHIRIIIIGSTVHVKPWPPHTGGFVILLRHLIGLLWTIDQPVAKASTYTGQHNTETQRQTSMPRAGFEPSIPVTKWPRPTDRLPYTDTVVVVIIIISE